MIPHQALHRRQETNFCAESSCFRPFGSVNAVTRPARHEITSEGDVRRAMRAYARAACAVLALGFASCDNAVTDNFGGILDLSTVTGVATGPLAVRPRIGWSSGQRVEFYDFGTTVAAPSVKDGTKIVAAANPMFWFVRASDNQPLYQLSGTPERDGLSGLSEPANPCYFPFFNLPPGTSCDASIVQHPIVDTIPGRT